MGSWCCVFPNSKTRSETIEWSSGQFLDAKDMAAGLHRSVIAFYEDILGNQSPRFGSERGRLTKDESKELIEILKPEVVGKISTADQVEFAEMEIGRLEEDQREMLGVIMDNPRVVLQGGAGSGKTVLGYMACMEKLRLNPHARVAFVCCSEYLANDIRKKAQSAVGAARFEVLSLPDVAKYYWNRMAKRDRSFPIEGIMGFWTTATIESWIFDGNPGHRSETELPSKLNEMLAAGRAEVARFQASTIFEDRIVSDRALQSDDVFFDFVVVDEAQDFIYSHIELCFLNLIIRGGLNGGNVLWIQDFFQSIRPSFVQTSTSDVPLFSPSPPNFTAYTLPAKNYRNPAGVTDLANSFARGERVSRPLRHKSLSVEVEFIENHGVLVEVLANVISREFAAGAKANDIAVITVDGYGEGRFRQGIKLDGFYVAIAPAHLEESESVKSLNLVRALMLMDAKGREFPIVILVDLPDMDLDFELNFMHVAITRAKAKLIVISTPERMATLRKIAQGDA